MVGMRNMSLRAVMIAAVFGVAMVGGAQAASVKEGLEALDKKAFDKAAKQFSDSFEADDADGGFYLGRMLELGVGSKPNPAGALLMYKAAAEKKSAKAMNRLGLMHHRGELGVLQDFETAKKFICGAADVGDKDGQFNCGELLASAIKVDAEMKPAIDYYEKAAAQGHIGAQNTLGMVYKVGKGVKLDLERAKKNFEGTASKGNPIGLFEFGLMHERGAPVPKNLAKAHLYYNLANARQHPDAAAGLQRITPQMKADEISRAQVEARSWKAKAEN
jgi:uncharacterized protein